MDATPGASLRSALRTGCRFRRDYVNKEVFVILNDLSRIVSASGLGPTLYETKRVLDEKNFPFGVACARVRSIDPFDAPQVLRDGASQHSDKTAAATHRMHHIWVVVTAKCYNIVEVRPAVRLDRETGMKIRFAAPVPREAAVSKPSWLMSAEDFKLRMSQKWTAGDAFCWTTTPTASLRDRRKHVWVGKIVEDVSAGRHHKSLYKCLRVSWATPIPRILCPDRLPTHVSPWDIRPPSVADAVYNDLLFMCGEEHTEPTRVPIVPNALTLDNVRACLSRIGKMNQHPGLAELVVSHIEERLSGELRRLWNKTYRDIVRLCLAEIVLVSRVGAGIALLPHDK